jgi:hypothetical protein
MGLGRGGWLVLTLVLAAAVSVPGLRQSFGDDAVVADDARLHVFWMQRFEDPSLFPDDPIADYWEYFESPGCAALYRLASTVGVAPLRFNEILPLALVALIAALTYALLLQMAIAPPIAFVGGALASLLAWMKDDVPSGTPRAFAYPLLVALMLALARRRSSPGLAADAAVIAILVLHALFYPPASLLALGVVAIDALLAWRARDRPLRFRAAVGLGLAVVVVGAILLPAAMPGPFGALYDEASTRAMPEYREGGRLEYWAGDGLEFWLLAPLSGLVAEVRPAIVLCGALLPLLLLRPERFPLVRTLRALDLLALPLISGVALFAAAHVFFPKLYFPSRYTHYSLRVVLAPATAVVIAILVDRALAGAPARARSVRAGVLGALVSVLILAYPVFAADYPVAAYHRTRVVDLHAFLRQQPADTVVASLSALADDIPTFAARTVLVSPHYAVAHHRGYYDRLRERTLDTIAGQYTGDPARLVAVANRWSVDYWLLDDGWDRPAYLDRAWLRQFQPAAGEARAFLERGGVPALATFSRCSVLDGAGYRLLDAACVRDAAARQASDS